jgi:hypothetical protein
LSESYQTFPNQAGPSQTKPDSIGGAMIYDCYDKHNVTLCPSCSQDDSILVLHGEPAMCKVCGHQIIKWGAAIHNYKKTNRRHAEHIYQILFYEDGYNLYLAWLKTQCGLIKSSELKVQYYDFHLRVAKKSLLERQRIKNRHAHIRRVKNKYIVS